jgi:triosephosphate isomerase (TIM)
MEVEMRKPIIAANWKMNNLFDETVKFFNEIGELALDIDNKEAIIAPSFPYLKVACDLAKDKNITIAAQDVYPAENGAFTGMVGSEMLNDLGVKAVVVGHSERRHVFKEGFELIRNKVTFVQKNNWKLIFCIGETLSERESGRLYDVIKEQIYTAFDENLWCDIENVVIAYEPVWAIGTGVVATPDQAQEMHAYIRKIMKTRYDRENIRILYGGSVKPDNIKGLMTCEDIDGALVGGASLKAESFRQLFLYDK